MVKKIFENSKNVCDKEIVVRLRGSNIEVFDRYNSFSCRFHKSIKNEVVSYLRGRATDYENDCFTGRKIFGDYYYDGNWVYTNRLNDICDVIETGFEKPNFTSGQLKRMTTNNLMSLYSQVKDLVCNN